MALRIWCLLNEIGMQTRGAKHLLNGANRIKGFKKCQKFCFDFYIAAVYGYFVSILLLIMKPHAEAAVTT
jgi:hypothetical protein